MDKTAPKLIRQWLDDEGRKFKWLARQAEVSTQTASQWLCGRQMPSIDRRKKLESITGLPVAKEEAWL